MQEGKETKNKQLFSHFEHINSIASLENLASSLNSFISTYNDLMDSLKQISQSIDARSPSNGGSSSSDTFPTPPCSVELKYACETMNGKCLRKYLIRDHLHDVKLLREELPRAILFSPNPTKLVLDCVGKFFTQRSRAYENNHNLSTIRQLSVLVLESMFLDVAKKSIEVHSDDQKTADEWAFMWKERMISDGGIGAACEDDASALLFLICAFGIPKHFNDDDVWNLVIISLNRHSASLSQSLTLSANLAGTLKKKMTSGLQIEALDVVRVFKMEDQFPLEKILKAYIKTQSEILQHKMKKAEKSPNLQKMTVSKHISALNSALKFIEERKYDTLKDTLQNHIAKVVHENDDNNQKKRKRMEIDERRPITKVVNKREQKKNEELALIEEFSSYNDKPLTLNVRQPFPNFATSLESFAGLPAGIYNGQPPPDVYAFVDKVVEMEFGSYYMHL